MIQREDRQICIILRTPTNICHLFYVHLLTSGKVTNCLGGDLGVDRHFSYQLPDKGDSKRG